MDAIADFPDRESILSSETDIIDSLGSGFGLDVDGRPYSDRISWDVAYEDGVCVLYYTPDQFLSALGGSMPEELDGHKWSVWEVPVDAGSAGQAYAIVSDNGKCTTMQGFLSDDTAHLYQKDRIDGLLDGRDFDSVHMTAVRSWGASFLITVDGEAVNVVPFAVHPDWMGLENGRWYKQNDIRKTLASFYDGQKMGPVSGGGGGSVQVRIGIGIVAVAGIGIVCTIIYLARTRRRDGSV